MQKDTKQKVKLGIFVAIVLVAFFFAIYYVGKNRNLFHEVTKVYTVFSDIKGLGRGSNVRFSGITVGTVSDINIKNDTTVRVEISIQTDYVKFIKEDSKVEITNDGLMGNKILIIHHGTADSPPVKEYETLQSEQTINIEDIVNEATKVIKNARDATNAFLDVSKHLQEGKGDLGKLIYDTSITHSLRTTMNQLAGHLAQYQRYLQPYTQWRGRSREPDLQRHPDQQSANLFQRTGTGFGKCQENITQSRHGRAEYQRGQWHSAYPHLRFHVHPACRFDPYQSESGHR